MSHTQRQHVESPHQPSHSYLRNTAQRREDPLVHYFYEDEDGDGDYPADAQELTGEFAGGEEE